MSASTSEKWRISFVSAFLFLLVVNPYTYKLTNKLLGGRVGNLAEGNGCPTFVGLFIHTIVYILLVRGSMDLHLFKD